MLEKNSQIMNMKHFSQVISHPFPATFKTTHIFSGCFFLFVFVAKTRLPSFVSFLAFKIQMSLQVDQKRRAI